MRSENVYKHSEDITKQKQTKKKKTKKKTNFVSPKSPKC